MAKQMNPENVIKKLKSVSNTQDSIPMLSLWIIHHKAHHKLIVDLWLKVLKNSKASHRLTLLYLCNDVIQNCRRKNAAMYKDAYMDTLPEAVSHLREESIRPNVQRVMKIWAKRGVFDTEYTDQLLAALLTNRAPEKLRNKLLVEYKTTGLISEITQFKQLEDKIEVDEKRLRTTRVDVSSTEAIKKLKDKVGGEKFSREFEESATQLDDFISQFEKYVERRKHLLDVLEKGTVYYHAQYHEAKIVVNAYQNFEGRVKKMKRGLDKVMSKFPSPVPSPSADAPSPIITPVDVDDDQEDMEMSDEDKELANKPSKIMASGKSFRRKSSVDKKPLGAGENVLRIISSNLHGLSSNEDSAEETLKRAMSSLVSRPGMRGSGTTENMVTDTNRTSLTITRPIEKSNSGDDSSKMPTSGSASPPSPTGSPELNISSPPRHQSLDSRLADLFSSGAVGSRIKDSADSDSGSDTGEASSSDVRSNFTESKTKMTDVLPGLGNLDEIKVKVAEELPAPPMNFYTTNPVPVSDTLTITVQNTEEKSTTISTSSHSIPVLRTSSRVLSDYEGSSTPTLDESPLFTQSSHSESNTFLSPPKFLTAVSDPMSFLSNVLAKSTKTDLSSGNKPPVSIPPETTSKSLLDTWPPRDDSSTIIPGFETEWDKRQATRNPTTKNYQASPSPTWPPPSTSDSWPDFKVSVSTTSLSSPIPPPPAPWDFPLLSTVVSRSEPQVKKPKWDDGAVFSDDPSDAVNMEAAFTATAGAMTNRRRSNLITLSTEDTEASNPASIASTTQDPQYEPLNVFKSTLRRKSHDAPYSGPPSKTQYDTPPSPHSGSFPTSRHAGPSSNPPNGSQFKSTDQQFSTQRKVPVNFETPSPAHHFSNRSDAPDREAHSWENENPENRPRMAVRPRGLSNSAPQRGARYPNPREVRPPTRYDEEYEQQLLHLELDLLEKDRIIEAELQREMSLMRPTYNTRPPRAWPRGPASTRSPHPPPGRSPRTQQQRMYRPPRPMRGSRPRMWY